MKLDALQTELESLPFCTADLPGIGGELKAFPEDFVVDEILPYAPCGEGEHVFVTIRRSGETTSTVSQTLARVLGVRRRDIGFAGMKDKQAVATQSFSFHQHLTVTDAEISARLNEVPYTVLDFTRHRHKLRTGHTRGNRFSIRLRGASDLAAAEAIAEALKERRLPNFYGEQRFGAACRGLERSIAIVNSGRASSKLSFNVSVVQAALFNCWLKRRLERGYGNSMILGDIAKKTDTGGLFTVDNLADAQERYLAGEIIYTGPIFGDKMMLAQFDAGAYEGEVLSSYDLALEDFRPLHAPGTRRPGLICVEDLVITAESDALCFRFSLPSGSYATMVMREFIKPAVVSESGDYGDLP